VKRRHRALPRTGSPCGQRQCLRDRIIREAGGLSYDHVEDEFRGLAACLRWPAAATIKDFRHLFVSSLANAGVPEPYRQYLMGQAAPKAAISAYTHLNKIRELYLLAVEREWGPVLNVLQDRVDRLPPQASIAI